MAERVELPIGMRPHPGEEVTFETHGWFAPWLWVMWAIIPALIIYVFRDQFPRTLISLAVMLIPLFIWWKRRHRHLVVTSDRVIYTKGILTRNQRIINIERVQDVGLQQGLLARLCGYGDLITQSAGETGNETIRWMSRVRGARDAILQAAQLREQT